MSLHEYACSPASSTAGTHYNSRDMFYNLFPYEGFNGKIDKGRTI